LKLDLIVSINLENCNGVFCSLLLCLHMVTVYILYGVKQVNVLAVSIFRYAIGIMLVAEP